MNQGLEMEGGEDNEAGIRDVKLKENEGWKERRIMMQG